MEIILKIIILIAGLFIPVIILVIPPVILEIRGWILNKTKLIGLYVLMAVIFYILAFIVFRLGLDMSTSPLHFLLGIVLIFTFIYSILMILYLLFEPIINRVKVKISWWKVLGIVILGIFIIAVILPLIPGILFAFGIKTENWPVQALIVEPVMFTIDEVTLSGIKGELMLQVQNSNPFPATMSKIDIEVYSTEGLLIAKGTIPYSVTIPPKKYKIVSCPFEIPWTGGGKFIYDKLIVSLKDRKLHLKVKGYVYLDLKVLTIPIPFSKDVYV